MAQIGTIIDDKYQILTQIGKGGMSFVYLARDTRLNKQWAVKEVRKSGSNKKDTLVINSLIAEANLMKSLDHPALPRIVDIIDDGITIYIVMDYIEGESLDKVLKATLSNGEFFSEESVIDWAIQICEALLYLHSKNIIYRDVKPANIMLNDDGKIKIIDFGIAREYKGINDKDTKVLGTKGYAPPEQYVGQSDIRSDIYALGVTMHQLLTGNDPCDNPNFVPVRQINNSLSEGIELIIDRCIEPALENRYQNCADLLYDLQHPDMITKGYKQSQKRKLSSFVICALLSIVLFITSISLNLFASNIDNNNYQVLLNNDNFYEAIRLDPSKVDAYNAIIKNCRKSEKESDDKIEELKNEIDKHKSDLEVITNENGKSICTREDVAYLYYNVGRLIIANWTNNKEDANFSEVLADKLKKAKPYFGCASTYEDEFDEKYIAQCFNIICNFVSDNNENEIIINDDDIKNITDKIDGIEKNSDKETYAYNDTLVCYVTMVFISTQYESMIDNNVNPELISELVEKLDKHIESHENSNNTIVKSLVSDAKGHDKLIDYINEYAKDNNRIGG